jgi:hypothetical protein
MGYGTKRDCKNITLNKILLTFTKEVNIFAASK